MVKEIVRDGDPNIRKVSKLIDYEKISKFELSNLMADMAATMQAHGGIGISAIQIGVPLQLMAIQTPEMNAPWFLSNCSMFPFEKFKGLSIEGCLSVPNQVGQVERYAKIIVNYADPVTHGTDRTINLIGQRAVVFQHEFDHFNGVLFTDKRV